MAARLSERERDMRGSGRAKVSVVVVGRTDGVGAAAVSGGHEETDGRTDIVSITSRSSPAAPTPPASQTPPQQTDSSAAR